MAESSTSSRSSGASTRRKGGRGQISPTAILDIVERLGLVDLLIDRVKGRLEEVDVDEILDEFRAYLKRNPEVLVVCLGAVTIAAGALVFLKRGDGRADGNSSARPRRPASSTSGNR